MKNKLLNTVLFYLLVLTIALIVLFPFLWMLTSSFKTQVDIISWPPKLFFEPTLQNYRKVFEEQDFLKYFLNSTIVGVMAVGLSLLLGSSCGLLDFALHAKKAGAVHSVGTPDAGYLVPDALVHHFFSP
jgi:ABC-type glycerol-3-phosphate transport system permease component